MLTPYFAMLQQWNKINGRVDRRTYWSALLAALVILAALLWFAERIPVLGFLPTLFTLLMVIPFLTMTVRRMNDSGHSWKTLLWIVIPVAGLVGIFIFLVQNTVDEKEIAYKKELAEKRKMEGPRLRSF